MGITALKIHCECFNNSPDHFFVEGGYPPLSAQFTIPIRYAGAVLLILIWFGASLGFFIDFLPGYIY